MKKLLLFALLASCEGRCEAIDAGMDTVGPGATCTSDSGGATSVRLVCLYKNQVWGCSTDGVFFKTARCELLGTMEKS